MILGENIQKLRREKNLDQKDLAKLLNVSVGTVSNYETKTHMPSFENVIKLANLFNVSIDYMLGNTSVRCSFSKFDEEITDGRTYGSLINNILALKIPELKSLIEYVELLNLRG